MTASSRARVLTALFVAALLLMLLTGVFWARLAAGDTSAGATFAAGLAMNVARLGHESATLSDGRVVLFGGHGAGFTSLNSAEVWTGSSFTSLTMNATHDGAAIAKFGTDGSYLIAGGAYDLGVAPGNNVAEIYDPDDNSFTLTGAMNYGRTNNSAATLIDGRVLVVGGWYDVPSATYAELYNRTPGTFALTGPLSSPRAVPVVLPTQDNKAVVFGGVYYYGSSTCIEKVELYDPATNAFSTLQDNLFVGDPGWCVYGGIYSSPMEEQLTADGLYLLLATRVISATEWQNTLFTFNPTTKQFQKLTTSPALPNTGISFGGWRPVVDGDPGGKAYLLGYVADTNPNQFKLYTVNPTTGDLNAPTGTYTFSGYYPIGTALDLLLDGRLLLTGGSSTNDYAQNFNAVTNSLLATPTAPPPPPAPVSVVVPNALANVEGNSNMGAPFNLAAFGTPSNRYQQVYSAGEIGYTGVIDKIAFRRNVSSGPFGAPLFETPFSVSGISVEIRLSHTPKAVDNLSTVFAENVGLDEEVVLDTTNLSLSSSGTCPSAGPCAFDIIIDLANTFTYNGTSNLLPDVRARNAVTTAQLDMAETFGDSVSNAFSSIPGGDVNSTSGVLFSRGIVTQFTFVGGATPTSTPTPTPTPATPAPTPTPTVPASTPTPTATTTPAATPTPTPTPTPHAVPGVSGPGLGVLAGALLLGTLLFVWRARRRAGAV